MKTKNISNFVLKFIEANKDSKTISDNWNTDKNLNALKKILKKHKKDNKDVNKPKRGKSSYLYSNIDDAFLIIICGRSLILLVSCNLT